ncbi:MAG TPA: LysR substrate-binding domain-containing protein [Candidatus Dormibacteraeota bacterium]|nr:LysR substrate-binding domain-containing protein [Candidatus Dormibacteraeota bacterium]
MDVHVRDLRYFLAVAHELSFTAASEKLYVSQPALSKQIRALERQLRVTLFDRGPGSVRLTRAGAELVPHAEEIVARWEQAKRSLSKVSDCTLVIGMHTSPGRGLLPRVRAMMVASCPEVELELRQIAWSDRTGGLSDRSTDAAFVWLPLPQPPYRWVTIAREQRLVALANGHRLAGRERVSIADLLDEPFLALPPSAGPLRDYWLALDDRGGHPVRVAAEINDTEETYEAVASGIGICLLASGNAPIFARGDVTMLPVDDLSPSELVLAWNERHCPPLLETFAALCEQVAAGELGPPVRGERAARVSA